jgi:5-methylcytosine-specific restriction protein A
MSIELFNSGDQPFLAWMKQNPKGFVMNTPSAERTSYLMFHKSQCMHIAGYTRSQEPGSFTERSYVKVCAHDPADLIAWARSNRKEVVDYKICRTCKPDIEATIAANPEEVVANALHTEGAARSIRVNSYERNVLARKACIEHYGAMCAVCGFNFAATYGEEFVGFIPEVLYFCEH